MTCLQGECSHRCAEKEEEEEEEEEVEEEGIQPRCTDSLSLFNVGLVLVPNNPPYLKLVGAAPHGQREDELLDGGEVQVDRRDARQVAWSLRTGFRSRIRA